MRCRGLWDLEIKSVDWGWSISVGWNLSSRRLNLDEDWSCLWKAWIFSWFLLWMKIMDCWLEMEIDRRPCELDRTNGADCLNRINLQSYWPSIRKIPRGNGRFPEAMEEVIRILCPHSPWSPVTRCGSGPARDSGCWSGVWQLSGQLFLLVCGNLSFWYSPFLGTCVVKILK